MTYSKVQLKWTVINYQSVHVGSVMWRDGDRILWLLGDLMAWGKKLLRSLAVLMLWYLFPEVITAKRWWEGSSLMLEAFRTHWARWMSAMARSETPMILSTSVFTISGFSLIFGRLMWNQDSFSALIQSWKLTLLLVWRTVWHFCC